MTAWTDYVKQFAKDNNMTYGCALSDPACSSGYRNKQPPKRKKLSQSVERELMGFEEDDTKKYNKQLKHKKKVENLKSILDKKDLDKEVSFMAKEDINRFVPVQDLAGNFINIPEKKKRGRRKKGEENITMTIKEVKKRGRPKKYSTAEEARKAKIANTIASAKKRKEAKGKGIINTIYNLGNPDTIKKVIQGRNDFSPKVYKIINQFSNKVITGITLHRTPLNKSIMTALQVASGNTFSQKLSNTPYEKLFHLFMCIDFAGKSFVLEKNEVINAENSCKLPSVTESKTITNIPPGLTLKQALDNTQKRMGNNFFTYSAKDNNCQDFIVSFLTANNIGSSNDIVWVKQDTKSLFEGNDRLRKITNTITDIGARIDVIKQGGMIEKKEGAGIIDNINEEYNGKIQQLRYRLRTIRNRGYMTQGTYEGNAIMEQIRLLEEERDKLIEELTSQNLIERLRNREIKKGRGINQHKRRFQIELSQVVRAKINQEKRRRKNAGQTPLTKEEEKEFRKNIREDENIREEARHKSLIKSLITNPDIFDDEGGSGRKKPNKTNQEKKEVRKAYDARRKYEPKRMLKKKIDNLVTTKINQEKRRRKKAGQTPLTTEEEKEFRKNIREEATRNFNTDIFDDEGDADIIDIDDNNDDDLDLLDDYNEGGGIINFEDMKWGSFSKQLEVYNRQHKTKLDLHNFAMMILANPKKYQKRTLKRARFYINVILKKGGNLPCWKNYEQIGMKNKNGKQVPNCVPKKKSSNNNILMPNNWINHVKNFAKKHSIKYNEALKHPDCKSSYKKGMGIPTQDDELIAIKYDQRNLGANGKVNLN